MRAITVSSYGASPSVTELPTPQAEPGQVLIATQAFGMNPMDMQIANGGWQDQVPTQFPIVLGADLAGTVREDAPLARIPAGLDPVIAAALPTVGVTAMQIAESLAPLDGKIVLIVGAAGATGRCRAHHPARAGRKPKIGRSREGRRGSWRSAGYVTASAHRCRARPPHLTKLNS